MIPARIRAISYAALCPVGFLIAALLVRLLVPWEPFIPSYTERMEFYRERADRFSMLFLGSSRVRAHINPRVIDAALDEAGEGLRSFNMGIDSLNLIELDSIVDEIIRMKPESLRYVVIEPVFSTNLRWRNVATERAIYFHDLRGTALEVRCNLSLPSMRGTVFRSLLAAGYNVVNLGRVVGMLAPPGAVKATRVPLRRLRNLRGYQAQDTIQDAELDKWRDDFVERREELQAAMATGRTLEQDEGANMPCHFDAVLDMARRLREAGIQPVFVNTPGFLWVNDSLAFEAHLVESGDPTPLLSYIGGNDDLYQHDLWYDHRHLKGEAATVFSRRLANDLSGLLPAESGI